MSMGPNSLAFIFDEMPWVSTFSFDPGIPVSLEATVLRLEFAPGVDPLDLLGTSFQLFDWTGVAPIFQFRSISGGYQWDASQLYTNGVVTLIPEPNAFAACTAVLVCFEISRRRSLWLRT
jgi:hypothetical protein